MSKPKPIRTQEHRQKHKESLKNMYQERKNKGLKWTGKQWIKLGGDVSSGY